MLVLQLTGTSVAFGLSLILNFIGFFCCSLVLRYFLFLSQAQSVALTLESGSFVKFQYDLGTGPIEITNWAVRVRPGHWYTAYATRLVTNLNVRFGIVVYYSVLESMSPLVSIFLSLSQ